MRPSGPFTVSALVVALAAGCNSLIGISDDATVVEPGSGSTPCLRNSDCSELDVCLFEVCSEPCAADRDCDDGERCFGASDGTYCAAHESTACATTDDCPSGSNCTESVCRNSCEDASECATDQDCVAGYCLGSDATHDPGAGSCTEGAVRCEGRAQTLRSVCNGGVWEPTDPCEGGQLCNSESDPPGECADVEEACFGLEPNAFSCDGAVRTSCGPDLVTVEVEECLSPQHCTAGTDGCAECLPNEYRCEDLEQLACNEYYTGFEPFDTCTEEDPCNAEAGACTRFACLPDQKRCMGDLLQECDSDQSAFTTIDECGVGLCDPSDLSCDVCQANVKSCLDLATALQCNSDGTMRTEVDCEGTTPFCQNGVCVECLDESDCDHGSCDAAVCNAGVCGTEPLDAKSECDGEVGYCDGEGTCRECVGPEHCGVAPDCEVNTCDDFTCGTAPKDAGEPCVTAGYQCNGEGDCVECIDSQDCMGVEVCRSEVCGESLVDHGWKSAVASTASIGKDVLYLRRIGPLAHGAVLLNFGVVGAEGNGPNAKMALYADAGGNPSGPALASTSDAIALEDGDVSRAANPPNVQLTAQAYYWIGIKVTTTAGNGLVAVKASGITSSGESIDDGYAAPFPTLSGTSIPGSNTDAIAIYVHVRETD